MRERLVKRRDSERGNGGRGEEEMELGKRERELGEREKQTDRRGRVCG